MGQQQLLLLVLGIVIVGLAVVVGIQAFGENTIKAKQDRYANEALAVAADVVAWQLKPSMLGGNQGGSDLSAVSLAALGREETTQSSSTSRHDDGQRILQIVRFDDAPMVRVRDRTTTQGSVWHSVQLHGSSPECWGTEIRVRQVGSVWSYNGSTDNPDDAACSW